MPGIDEAWLRRWHDRHAGATSRAFGALLDARGRTSYLRLAEHVGDGDRVLDLACGDGRLLEDVLRVGPALAVGVDHSAGELEAARSRLAPRVELVEGRVQVLPFDDESFDRVLCHMALMLFDDLEAVLREVRRVLSPGGTFGVILGRRGDASDGIRLWGEELRTLQFEDRAHIVDARPIRGELPTMLGDAGFDNVDVKLFDISDRLTLDEAWEWFAESYDPERLSAGDRVAVESAWRARATDLLDGGGRLEFRFPMQEIRAS